MSAPFTVTRSTRTSWAGTAGYLAVALVLALAPLLFGPNVIQQLTSFLILVILAAMWNALAGYGGLVSVGQQAYIGFGAYTVIFLTQRGVAPYLAVVFAALAAGVLALVIAPLVLRLRGGQFSIGTWVIAEALALVVVLDTALGGGTGVSLRGLNVFDADTRRAYTYWLTLAFVLLLLGALVLLPVVPFVWTTPSEPIVIALMVASGAMGSAGHYFLIAAHRLAPAAVLSPFIYTEIPLMIVLGFLVFADLPNRWTLTGAAIVVASGLYILHRETTLARRRTLATPAPV